MLLPVIMIIIKPCILPSWDCNVITEPLYILLLPERVNPGAIKDALSEDAFVNLSDQDDGRGASSLQLLLPCTNIWPPDRGISSLGADRF